MDEDMKAIYTLHKWGWSVLLAPGADREVQDLERREIDIDYTQDPSDQAWIVEKYPNEDVKVYALAEEGPGPEGVTVQYETGKLLSVFYATDWAGALGQAELFVEALSKVLPCVKYVHFSAGNTKAAANVTIVEEDKPEEQEYLV